MKPAWLLLLLAAAAVACAQPSRAAGQSTESASRTAASPQAAAVGPIPSRSLPDLAELLRRLKANQKQLEERRKDYLCQFTEEIRTLNGRAVTKTETKGYELFYESGYPIARLVSKQGKPLDAREERKESDRVDEQIRKDRALAAKHATEGENPDEVRIDHILHATVMNNGRYENYRGREVLAFDFAPNPDFKPHSRADNIANKLVGTVWIDVQDVEVARLEAHLIDTFRVAGGLLGSVKPGSDLVVEQERVNGEVWLPSFLDFSLDARVLLLKSVHERIIDRFSNYRKFRVETTINPAEQQ